MDSILCCIMTSTLAAILVTIAKPSTSSILAPSVWYLCKEHCIFPHLQAGVSAPRRPPSRPSSLTAAVRPNSVCAFTLQKFLFHKKKWKLTGTNSRSSMYYVIGRVWKKKFSIGAIIKHYLLDGVKSCGGSGCLPQRLTKA